MVLIKGMGHFNVYPPRYGSIGKERVLPAFFAGESCFYGKLRSWNLWLIINKIPAFASPHADVAGMTDKRN